VKQRDLSSRISTISILAILISFLTPGISQAREEKALKQCSAGNPFEFSVDWERNRVDFDFDIERGTAFESWTIRIQRNESTLVQRRMTSDEDGDLSREFMRRGQLVQGETWNFLARSKSGNTCRATLRF
jgi:hypothetical protein